MKMKWQTCVCMGSWIESCRDRFWVLMWEKSISFLVICSHSMPNRLSHRHLMSSFFLTKRAHSLNQCVYERFLSFVFLPGFTLLFFRVCVCMGMLNYSVMCRLLIYRLVFPFNTVDFLCICAVVVFFYLHYRPISFVHSFYWSELHSQHLCLQQNRLCAHALHYFCIIFLLFVTWCYLPINPSPDNLVLIQLAHNR